MDPSKIIVRYLNGRILKGHTQNFFPNKPGFHVRLVDADPSAEPEEVLVKDLKAVFFVRDFQGNREYTERKTPLPGEKHQGRLIEVTFRDGEVLAGSTTGYDPKRSGFFLFPLDPGSNNLKAYVMSAGVTRVRYL